MPELSTYLPRLTVDALFVGHVQAEAAAAATPGAAVAGAADTVPLEAATAPSASGQTLTSSSGNHLPSASSSVLAGLGIQRPIYVFSQHAVEAAGAAARSATTADPPDEFYEFTVEDWAAQQRAADSKKKVSNVLGSSRQSW